MPRRSKIKPAASRSTASSTAWRTSWPDVFIEGVEAYIGDLACIAQAVGADGGRLNQIAYNLHVEGLSFALADDRQQHGAALRTADLADGVVEIRADNALAVDRNDKVIATNACVPGRLILKGFGDRSAS